MEDILRQLDLAGVERLSGATQALGVAVPVSLLLAMPGNLACSFGLRGLRVGAGDLEFKLVVVPAQPARPYARRRSLTRRPSSRQA